jgi:hypothetical protein
MAGLTPKQKLQDIYLDLNIRRFADRYFGKTGGWLYHKFDRVDVNGTGHPEDFTEEQLAQLKTGLYDLADRIKAAADKL